MYRERSLIRLKNGQQWNEVLALTQELNELARARGWTEASVWTQTFGSFNEIVLEREFADLATYEREAAAAYGDAEFMQRVARAADLMSGGYNELWQRAEPVALA